MKKILFILLVVAGVNIQAQDVLNFGVTQSSKQVATASKGDEKITDAPGIVSVISKEEIANFGSINSLWDILNRATSMYMLHAGVLSWNVASIRGQHNTAYDNHVLMLLNGRPLREGISGGFNSVVYNSFPVESIQRIEIIRGPGSVLYGTNAFSGVINIITDKAEEESNFQLNSQYGSFDTKVIKLGGGIHVNDDLNINIGGQWYDDKGSDFGGFYDSKVVHHGDLVSPIKAKRPWSRDNRSTYLNVNYKSLSFSGGYAEIEPYSLVRPIKWDWNGLTAGEEIAVRRYFSDIGYSRDINNVFSISANLTYNGINELYKIDTVKATSHDILGEVSLQATPSEKVNIIAGATYELNSIRGLVFEDNKITKYSVYSQFSYRPINKLKLIAGAQLNGSSSQDVHLSPRAGIVYNANDNFGVKALYSTAFRSPYPEETFILHPTYIGNPTLKPELIATTEIQAFYQNDKFSTSLTFYNSKMTNLIIKMAIPANDSSFDHQGRNISYFNASSAIYQGLEWEAKYKIDQQFTALANATFQQNKGGKNKDGKEIKNPATWPNRMMKVGLMYNGDKVSGGIFNSYFSKPTSNNYMLEQFGKPLIEELNPEATAYNLLSMNIEFHLTKIFNIKFKHDINLGFYGDNLLDESIWFPEFVLRTVNTLPMHTGRSLYGKLTFKL